MKSALNPRRTTAALLAATATVFALGMTASPAFAAVDPDDITDKGGATRNAPGIDLSQALRDSIQDRPATNVILLIGDGMGDSEITIARNYAEGAAGRFAGIDALPLTGAYTTFSLREDGTPDYDPESASTASAWSTGTKTVDGRLSVDVDNVPQGTLLEYAKANGLRTGDVSTAEIQDATPAAQVAHISARGCYGPDQTAPLPPAVTACPGADINTPREPGTANGLGSITEQLLNVRPDVTLGGGAATFGQRAQGGPWEGQTLLEQAEDRGYQIVTDAAGLAGVTEADADTPLLGLFAPGNFPVRYTGPAAVDLTAGGELPAPARCTENPARLDTGLSLAALTDKAIELLDNENEAGFFLQVEGASIDKRDHAADACGQIGETVDLDEAVRVALDFAEADGNTLVVVTADHAHTSQIVDGPIPGLNTHLLTDEGAPMIVAYGTSPAGGSQQHTGTQVRIAAYGPGGANVVGLTDQTDLFFTTADGLELNQDLPSLSADATLDFPAQVAPGATFAVTTAGLDADWQVEGAAAASEDLGQQDVLRGVASFEVVAPEEEGEFTVTLTGRQTGTVLTATVVVTATPTTAPSAPPTTPAAAGGGATRGSGGGPLALTGGTVPFAAGGLAVALLAAGGYLVLRRHRRRHLIHHN